jgi:hypothetical protein
MNDDKVNTFIQSDEILSKMDDRELAANMFSSRLVTSGQYSYTETIIPKADTGIISSDFRILQGECWNKYQENPLMATAIEDGIGRLTGRGFETYSDIPTIQGKIDEISNDPRNALYDNIPKFVGRKIIEGELFIMLTVHDDGFIEIDFKDPGQLYGAEDNSGIYRHPTKQTMPVAYSFCNQKKDQYMRVDEVIPSIHCARYKEIAALLEDGTFPSLIKGQLVDSKAQGNKTKVNKYSKLNGYRRFIIEWNTGLFTKRNLSTVRTVISWLSRYQDLKMFELSHKKSCGTFAHVITCEDPKMWRIFNALTDDEKQATGIFKAKEPGCTLLLPPGFNYKMITPNLPSISDSDTDILELISAGLNISSGQMTGSYNNTYGSAKESNKPQTDRTNDILAKFETFLRYIFWDNIFYLASQVSPFKYTQRISEAVDFNKNKEPIFRKVTRKSSDLINFSFPVSAMADSEGMAKALLGVKHGNVNASLGIPNSEIARKLGMGGSYKRLRLQSSLEAEQYPELQVDADTDAGQEGNLETSSSTQEGGSDVK